MTTTKPDSDLQEALHVANDILRSCFMVAERMAVIGTVHMGTNWGALHEQIGKALDKQLVILNRSPAAVPECGSITTNEAMKYLDEGFDIKVLNPERGTYWRCSYCGRDDSEQHDEGCLIRRLVRHAQATPRSATGSIEDRLHVSQQEDEDGYHVWYRHDCPRPTSTTTETK